MFKSIIKQNHTQRYMFVGIHDLPHLPCSNLATMAFMHRHVNVCSWHQNNKTLDEP